MFGAKHNIELARKFWGDVLNGQNVALVPVLLSPKYKFNGHPSTSDATIAWVKGLHAKYPGLQFTIEDILADEHKVALRWRLDVTDPASGKKGYFTGTNIIVVEGGQALTNDQGGGTDFVPLPG